ncbi:hypothetical protein HYH02_009850 [Chlamydomonas schloesseri]|uniref:Uncharacterized protein n=1 Tax=Chlamydomonas schloesseri TaxID=2026947 RepID=A0A835TAX8_9CHLO|nr:hypothetical protein HYH02_009850 [Chlamydomonas schloesseri]|eukprot:KAG2442059.1 hypothetical protein HYH02_009850 [Chlamydomonas schloesseri]
MFATLVHARRVPHSHDVGDYCPPEPASGFMDFRSVDSVENSMCVPVSLDLIGTSVYTCFKEFRIDVVGCDVTMRTDADLYSGPGRMPCALFGLKGNLTPDGLEARMWADVDGRGLLDYFRRQPESVAALKLASPQLVVKGIWAFLRTFTTDTRFADDSWIDGGGKSNKHGLLGADGEDGEAAAAAAAAAAEQGWADASKEAIDDAEAGDEPGRRRLLVARTSGQGKVEVAGSGDTGRLEKNPVPAKQRHGPMRVYRPAATRITVKVPNGCKYKYTIEPSSHVFEVPDRGAAVVHWRTVALTVAALSVVLAGVGLGVCTHFSRKHAEYVSSFWEYQAVKDQLGAELPPHTYQRLFGELPKSAAAAQEAAAAAAAAVQKQRAQSAGAGGGGGGVAVGPAVQQHAPAALAAEAGEAQVIGAGEPDGISSRSSSAGGSEIGTAADAALRQEAGAAAAAAATQKP